MRLLSEVEGEREGARETEREKERRDEEEVLCPLWSFLGKDSVIGRFSKRLQGNREKVGLFFKSFFFT